jgi:hypothetical protein
MGVIRVADVGAADVRHGGVVVECAVIPAAAEKSGAAVAESIIDAAVKTDRGPPVAGVESVDAVRPSQYPGVHNRPTRGGSTQVPGTQ